MFQQIPIKVSSNKNIDAVASLIISLKIHFQMRFKTTSLCSHGQIINHALPVPHTGVCRTRQGKSLIPTTWAFTNSVTVIGFMGVLVITIRLVTPIKWPVIYWCIGIAHNNRINRRVWLRVFQNNYSAHPVATVRAFSRLAESPASIGAHPPLARWQRKNLIPRDLKIRNLGTNYWTIRGNYSKRLGGWVI